MSRLFALWCAVFMLVASYVGHGAAGSPGITEDANLEIGLSEKFSEEEIQSAMDVVLARFQQFTGCRLTRLWYDEARSNASFNPATTNKIMLLADFTTSKSSESEGFDADTVYTQWQFALCRSGPDGAWWIKDWGYA